jgi:general stress protein 26
MTANVEIISAALDLLHKGAGADEWREILSLDAEFEVLNGHLAGRDEVAERLASTRTAHLDWSKLDLPKHVLAGRPRSGTGDRGIALTIVISEDKVVRVSQQNLAMPPRAGSPMVMDAALRERFDTSLATKNPMSLSYVDQQGRPHLSLRGSLRTFGDDRLAMWARSADTGLAVAVEANPNVALLYRDEEKRATYQLSGRAHVVKDETTRLNIYNAMPKVERDHDFAMLGAAIIVVLDLVEGWAGISPSGPIDPIRLVRD